MALEQLESLPDAGQHAERQNVDLEDAERVEVVLVPLDHGAVCHRGVDHGHDLVEARAGQNEAADVLREMAGKARELGRELECQAQARGRRIEAALARELLVETALAPAPDAGRERADRILREAQGLADLADRAPRTVVDHGRRDPGMLAPVFFVDVLNHFLAPLVLEVDVDVGRLLALGRDETLEQKVEALRIDRGDAEAIADRGIGRRAPALAEDAFALREAHEVVHGQKIGRVAELLDQQELVLEQLCHFGRRALGIALGDTLKGQPREVLLDREPRRRRIDRIVISQFVQGKTAGLDDLERARERPLMTAEQAQGLGRRLQMALGVGLEPEARPVDRRMLADAGQHVLQGPALGDVVEHVAGRDQRCPAGGGEPGQRLDARRIVAAIEMLRGEIAELAA